MCNCKQETEHRLLESLPAQLPEGAQDLRVSLGGYAVVLETGGYRQSLPIEINYKLPTKGCSLRVKRSTMNMLANYCMFCGVKYEQAT